MKIARSMIVSLIVMLGVIVGTAVLVEPVSAGIKLNTIDPTAKLLGNGQRMIVTGPISCDKGEDVEISIVVKQESTGAIAKGSWHGRCSGKEHQWKVNASTDPGPALTVGTAKVSAQAVTSVKGNPTPTETRSWWKEVNVEQSGHQGAH